MQETRMLMGMPIAVEMADENGAAAAIEKVFTYFNYVDEKFSTYKPGSEISKINHGLIKPEEFSADMLEVLELSEKTKHETNGFFDIKKPDGLLDPSGLVKGWAIYNAAKILKAEGYNNFFIEAGGDIQAEGVNSQGEKWRVGIRNPFNSDPNQAFVKILLISGQGVATSGNYLRGEHIYNPKTPDKPINDIVSLTVIGPNVYEADRFATAAFAMGPKGIYFIEQLPGFEGYLINKNGQATETTGWFRFSKPV